MQGRRSLHKPLANPLEKPKRKRRTPTLPEVEDIEQQPLDSSSLEEESSTGSRSPSLTNTREEELDNHPNPTMAENNPPPANNQPDANANNNQRRMRDLGKSVVPNTN